LIIGTMYIFTRVMLEYVGWFYAQIIGGLDIFISGRAGRLAANWFLVLQISSFFFGSVFYRIIICFWQCYFYFTSASTSKNFYLFGCVRALYKIFIFSGVFVLIILFIVQCYVNTTASEVAL
jgi:hypothetical protein